MTDLIIQILTEEDAKILKDKIFGDLAKVVKGSYSGTYGLMIPFPLWLDYSCSSTISKFLYGESQIELRPEELMYYEFGQGWDHCEEVGLFELYPTAGFYRFDREKVMQIEPSTGRIFYYGDNICRVNEIDRLRVWTEKITGSTFRGGLSKIYRRGFINEEIRYRWINELCPDILQDC